jgi:hypothetical protein
MSQPTERASATRPGLLAHTLEERARHTPLRTIDVAAHQIRRRLAARPQRPTIKAPAGRSQNVSNGLARGTAEGQRRHVPPASHATVHCRMMSSILLPSGSNRGMVS